MAMECNADRTVTPGTNVTSDSNSPGDGFQLSNPTEPFVAKYSDEILAPPSSNTDYHPPPWSTLGQMKKEANDLAMNLYSEDDQRSSNVVQNVVHIDTPAVSLESSSGGEADLSDKDATETWGFFDTSNPKPKSDEGGIEDFFPDACGIKVTKEPSKDEPASEAWGFLETSNTKPKSDQGGIEDFFPDARSIKDAKEPSKDEPSSPNAPMMKASPTSNSGHTTFEKESSGYVYPTKIRTKTEAAATSFSASIDSSVPKPGEEGPEHTMETFNRFLEVSSMTADSCDFAVAMGDHGNPSGDIEASNAIDAEEDQDSVPEYFEESRKASRSLWPERLLRTRDMANAPSGILLVFDRMLDCIDPGAGSRSSEATRYDEKQACGYETDQSSVWSLSMNRSWLVREFGDISITGSISTDDGSLGLLPKAAGTSPAAEWLDESLDCIFPCWRDDIEPSLKRKAIDQKALSKAFEANRKRKLASEREANRKALNVRDPKLEEAVDADEVESKVHHGIDGKDHNTIETAISHPSNDFADFPDDPFDFPPPEFPLPVWKKQGPGQTSDNDNHIKNDADNTSGSSLSELFEGLIFGSPSDEKEDDDDELQRILDRTSTTEETSTLSYSDGTI